MGVGAFIGLIIMVILTVLIAVIFFPEWKRKRVKRWRIIGVVLLLIVYSPIFFISLEPYFYFKSYVISDLKKVEITLVDDFKIEDNKVEGTSGYNRTTTIIISKKDKERITKKIKEAKNYKQKSFGDFSSHGVISSDKPSVIYNYRFVDEVSKELVRESFEKENGYAARLTSVRIRDIDNRLIISVVH